MPANSPACMHKLHPEPPQAGAQFGSSVAAAGPYVAVGARKYDGGGAVFVFEGSACAWRQAAVLEPVAGTADALFGAALAMETGRIVVGAPTSTIGGISNAGSVAVFDRSGSGWTRVAHLTEDVQQAARFGTAVAVSGDTIAIGAPGARVSETSRKSGFVAVFVREGGSWTLAQKLYPDGSGTAGDEFGSSVALNGAVLVIGARSADDAQRESGKAYVYRRDSGGVFQAEATLSPRTEERLGFFGHSVAISPDARTIAVGHPGSGLQGTSAPGEVQIFAWSGSSWTRQGAPLEQPGNSKTNLFGNSVALTDDTVLVGIPEDKELAGDVRNPGSTMLFTRSGSNWTAGLRLTAGIHSGISDLFGESVAMTETLVIAGSDHDDDHGSQSGSAYVFG